MNVVHLTASTFFGGPERQMLGLAEALTPPFDTSFISFPEKGNCSEFLNKVRSRGFSAYALQNDFPNIHRTVRELTTVLQGQACNVVLCHGYKPNIIGRIAAKRLMIPCVAVSRGWTGENRKVRLYEWLDRRHLRLMDHVVSVSEGQAEKVRRWARVPQKRHTVIRNSARLSAFEHTSHDARSRLLSFFGSGCGVSRIVVAAGRLSPEKGFGVLVEAAAQLCRHHGSTGLIIFGEGVLRQELEYQIAGLGLSDRVLLPGFRNDLDSLIAGADVVVLPSFTEGLPNVALEASAAGVPVVATAVGGCPEVIIDGVTGFLVPPGEPKSIATRVQELLDSQELSQRVAAAARQRMLNHFTFNSQASAYRMLLDNLCGERKRLGPPEMTCSDSDTHLVSTTR